VNRSANGQVPKWIKEAGYSYHPFCALYAEADDNLEAHFTEHIGFFEEYAMSSSTIIVGARGSGKTANRIKLAEILRDARDDDNFVLVYSNFAPVQELINDGRPQINHHLWQILQLGADKLLSADRDVLSPKAQSRLHQLQERCSHFNPFAPYWHWLELWQEAVLSNYKAIYVLIDERDSPDRAPTKSPSLFAPLLDGDLFSLGSLFIKLFLPDDLRGQADEFVAQLDKPVQLVQIHWGTKELNFLLQNLLGRARIQASEDPFGPWLPKSKELERITQFPFASEIDDRFVQTIVANDPVPRPRSLIRLGRILFDQCTQNWKPNEPAQIRFQDWASALKRWIGTLNVRQPIDLEKIRLRFINLEVGEEEFGARIAIQENPADIIRLPYSRAELWAVLWALERHAFNELIVPSNSPHLNVLEKLELVQKSMGRPALAVDLLERVGEQLYACLSVSRYFVRTEGLKVEQVQQLRDQGIDARVWLEFRFDPDTVDVASYPWELICHQGVFLLQTQPYELTRYIVLENDEPALELTRPFTMLYTAPRPGHSGLAFDKPRIEGAFQQFGNRYQLRETDPPTFPNLRRIARGTHQAWHFDGHGTFKRRCPICKKRIQPWSETCCEGQLTAGPFGYLEFQNTRGRRDLRKAADVLRVLYTSGVRLAIVNGCKTASQSASPAFGGIAPALIRARIPAVVAMLLSIADPAAGLFIEGFYQTLAGALEGGQLSGLAAAKRLIQAVSEGRQRVLDVSLPDNPSLKQVIRRQWFIPILHLRYREGWEK
jgi:hypothetical protein